MGEFQIQKCEVCKKGCVPIPTSNIVSSEWLCRNCHKSYPMDPVLAQGLINQEHQDRAQNNGR